MAEQKFLKGDLAKIITTDEKVIVIEYKINYAGGMFNNVQHNDEENFPDSVITEDVLCEGRIDGKFQRKYIREASLQLITRAE